MSIEKNEQSGWLTRHFEQGWEGRIEWAFMDATFPRASARSYAEAGLVLLENGDDLTVFNPDGTTLWTGVLEKVQGSTDEVFDNTGALILYRLISNDPDRFPYSEWMPKDIAAVDWLKWCYHEPPLRAILKRCW